MVNCTLCNRKFKTITELHLQKKHGMSLREYMTTYPEAKIRDDFDCQVCEVLVTHVKSPRARYCKECSEQVNQINVRNNVRKYMARKKKLAIEFMRDANKSYGVHINENSQHREVRVDETHSAWDAMEGTNFKILGTFPERNLDIKGKNGHLVELNNLRRGINKIKNRRKRN